MRQFILASLLLVPALAMAGSPECKFHADRNLDLDFGGVSAVKFVVNSHDLTLSGGAAAGKGHVQGRACGSDQDSADNLVVTQRKEGDTLVVELTNKEHREWNGWGNHYAYLKVDASIPSSIRTTVAVGSGDAKVSGVASLDSSVGSGDLEVRNVKGRISTTVGSGDVKLDGVGPVDVQTVGSGDLVAKNVTGGVKIGTVGSGDAKLTGIGGDVEVGTVGSGDLDVNGVKGNLTVRTVGSGDVDHKDVSGKVDVPKKRD